MYTFGGPLSPVRVPEPTLELRQLRFRLPLPSATDATCQQDVAGRVALARKHEAAREAEPSEELDVDHDIGRHRDDPFRTLPHPPEHFGRNGTWWVPTWFIRVGADGPTFGACAATARGTTPLLLVGLVARSGFGYRGGTTCHAGCVRRPSPNGDPRTDSTSDMDIVRRIGLPILAGTDAGASEELTALPGFPLHAELAMYVAEGLTPLAALQAATLNPARFLHGADRPARSRPASWPTLSYSMPIH